jgi:hypothetical protein
MYEASQFVPGTGNILYLADQRVDSNGTTAVDFELNQVPPVCPNPAPPAPQTCFNQATRGAFSLNRTAGDLLIVYDFVGGGATPRISAYTWATSLSAGRACIQPASVPCWSAPSAPPGAVLDPSVAVASVNNFGQAPGFTGAAGQCGTSAATNQTGCQIYDPFRGIWGRGDVDGSGISNAAGASPCPASGNIGGTDGNLCRYSENPVPALRFGEVAINMTAAHLFPQGTCEAFGSVFAKTRASGSSLGNALKDVIAPVPMYLSNCLQVSVGYQDNAGGSPSDRPGPPHTMSPWGQTGPGGACTAPTCVGGGVANFVGCNFRPVKAPCVQDPTVGDVYDGGALLFTNTSRAAGANGGQGENLPVTNVNVAICISSSNRVFRTRNLIRADTCANPSRTAAGAFDCFFQPWGSGTFTVPPGDGTTLGSNQMILTQTGITSLAPWGTQPSCTTLTAPANLEENFDTSETIQPTLAAVSNGEPACPQQMPGANTIIPLVRFHFPGPAGSQLRESTDTAQVLNSGGVDVGCFGQNETAKSGTFVPLS